MNSFLEKLKRGMGIESDDSDAKVNIVPNQEKNTVGINTNDAQDNKSRKFLKKIDVKTKATEKSSSPPERKNDINNPKTEKMWFGSQEGQLMIDLYETENELVVQSAVAGIKADDLDISIENDKLSIKGVRTQKIKEEKKKYLYQECYWGAFSREVILPCEVDLLRTQALLQEGILTIRLPKVDREKRRKIEIKS